MNAPRGVKTANEWTGPMTKRVQVTEESSDMISAYNSTFIGIEGDIE